MFAQKFDRPATASSSTPGLALLRSLLPARRLDANATQTHLADTPLRAQQSSLSRDWSTLPVFAPHRGPAPGIPIAKGDGPDAAGPAPEESAAPAPAPLTAPAPTQAEVAPAAVGPTPAPPKRETVEETLSGTIPDIVTPPGGGRATGSETAAGEPAPTADTPGRKGPTTDGAASEAASVVANIDLKFSQPKREGVSRGGKQDPVTSGVRMGAFSQPSGRVVSPFGSEFYEPAFTGISYAFAGGKCTITATLNAVCPWGTNSGGDINVPTGASPVITATNWPAIKADLEPGRTTPFKSKRDKYYSQPLVERHEKFHGTDDLGWTRSTGLGIVKTVLEAGAVSAPSAAADVASLVNGARTRIITDNNAWYKGAGTDHDSFAGEIRAYADGRPHYLALSKAVEATGKRLAEQESVHAQIERERLGGATEYREGGRNVPAP